MKEKNKPTISFITPNYNDGNTIERYVESIMDQDYKYKELIIVDDGSTDDSKKVLSKLKKKYPDNLKVIYNKHQGACVARNTGVTHSSGKYLSFLPADSFLYPGVARIWAEKLEECPEYDFLYGGYKFVDENYHELFSYLGDHFDPYFLKVTNYIDGSYPLKRELFDKMGGWDPQIKSLQDWDFWLNAVLKHDAKGLYIREVFFETTYPHPGGLSDDSSRNWLERTKAIKKKYDIKQKKICVASNGATFHAKNIAKNIGADFLEMPSFKPHKYEMIYVIGFFGNVKQMFHNTNCMRVLHWIGSDILSLQQAKPEVREQVVQWIENNIDINLCEFEETQKELDKVGIKARIQPLPPSEFYEPMELPEKFAVAVYQPYQNKAFYQPELIRKIAKKLPNIDFYLFGDSTMMGKKDNLISVGNISDEKKKAVIKKTSMILRLTPHDGLPLSVIEWITAGRHAATTVKMKYSKKTKMNVNDAVKKIKEIKDIGVSNLKGSKYYTELCDVEKYKEKIYNLMKFDMKEWWENMSKVWHTMAASYFSSKEIIAVQKELKKLKCKTVVDIGCGSGEWCELLLDDYTGVDISKKLIKQCKKKYPDKKFINSDILSLSDKIDKKFDIAFTFTCFLHVRPEEIKENIKALKKVAKYGVFVEPIKDGDLAGAKDRSVNPEIIKMQKENPDFVFNVKYTWIHDYMSLFDVQKVITLPDNRNLFIVKL